MDSSKVKYVKRNIVQGTINKIITLMFPFAIRSIIIWKLGIEYVGLNSLFSSVLQVLSLAELGVGSAVVFSMYEPIVNNNSKVICALLYFYRKVYRIIGTIILAIGIVLIPSLKYLIAGDIPANINIYILYIIYLFNTIISYYISAYKQSLLLANQRFDVEMKISTMVYVCMYTVQITSLLFLHNYYWYIIWLPMATVMLNIVRSYTVERMYPAYKADGIIEPVIKQSLYKRVLGLMLTRICQVCRNSFDSIIISAYLGLTILGKYQNYYYIMNTLIGFLAIISSSVVASIGNNIVTKTIEDNYKQFNAFFFGYNWIASWCTVCLLCLYQPFMKLWLGEANMFPFLLVILMCIYFYSLKMGDVVAIYKEAAGIYWEDKLRPVVESLVNLLLNILLVKYAGVYGVLLSTIISIVFINIPWSAHIFFKVYFKTESRVYLKKICRQAFLLLIVGIVTYLACLLIPDYGCLMFLFKCVICLFAPNLIYWIIYCSTSEFIMIKNLIFRKIGGNSNE